jgi:hypothetical protein
MGIGLTVVAGLTRAMGGAVRAERGVDGGLAVVVRLRAADAPPPADASPTADASPADRDERGPVPAETAR